MANRDNGVVDDFFHRIMVGEWEDVISNCREQRGNISLQLTKMEDNVIHLAVNRGEMGRLTELINIASLDDLERKNKEGNTPLHLAAMRGDQRMCEQLCRWRSTAVTVRNKSGEAPMYLASVIGEMGAFSFLLGKFMELFSVPEPQVSWDQMRRIQRKRFNDACIRKDKDTILHAAIRGEFIDLAYKIFEQFRHLAIIKNRAGETPIHLLAKLPSSFKSGYRPGIIKLLVYNFIPDNFALTERSERLAEEDETRIQNDQPALNEISESSETENEATSNEISESSETENEARIQNDVSALNEISEISETEKEARIQNDVSALNEILETSQPENKARIQNDVSALNGISVSSQTENQARIQNDVWALNEISEISETENEASNYIKFIRRKLITLGRVLHSTFKMEKVMGLFLPKSLLKEKRKHVLSYTMVEGIIKYLKQQHGVNQSNPWMRSENATTPSETYTDAPIVSAVKMGITEMVTMIVQSFPFTVEEVDRHRKNLVFLAAESRQPQVLWLLLKLNIRQTLVTERLEDRKNVLHVAAELKEDHHHPWSITSGAPLQMHLEVKWFELVKALMPSHLQLCENNNGEKPNEVFMRTHAKLVVEALEWLSSTSRSCTVISSLLTTAALATAATVPGGVNGVGVPNLKDEWRFKLFSISALMSLCFGVLSLVMFLAILSSRLDAKNFKVGLPGKLIYGLTTLYLSLSTLLLAFCTAQSFAMHGRVRSLAYALYAILSSSIIYLVKEQIPLFLDFIEITFAKLQNWSNN